ncbi:MAG: ABC transporter substrate-binding protein [Acetobacteraceae bacterium]
MSKPRHQGLRSFGLTRRTLLAGAAAGLAAPYIIRAEAAEPIKIGLLLAKTGDIAGQTEYLANGSFMALAERNNTLLGRPAELIWYDEPSPQGAEQNMRKLVEGAKVAAVLGGSLSSDALAEEAAAERLKIPFVCDNAAATEMTGKNCNRYTFRLNTPVEVQAKMFSPYVLSKGKKWYFLTSAYAFGQDIASSFTRILKEHGGTVVGADSVPLNTPDYSSFILKIRQAKPEVILGGLTSGDLSTFLKQWEEIGMRGKIPFCEIAVGDTDLWALPPEAATGLYTSLWWYLNPANPPDEKAFAAQYQKKYGKPAADKAWMGWVTARSLFDSIEAAKSTRPDAIIEALENWRGGSADSPYIWRKGDHQMLLRNLVVQVKDKIPDRWDYLDVVATLPKSASELNALYGSPAANGCHMT